MNPPLANANWFEDDRLYACAFPNPANLQALSALGIRVIINLDFESHGPVALENANIREIHYPCPDFTAPTQAQLHACIDAIARVNAYGQAVAVHCRAGLGRTGTVLACWLVSTGMAPDEAINEVRRRRPGSIETADQEAAIRMFAEHLH